MAKVSKRGGFSDRNKIKPENTEIQLRNFDERTRIQLQNMISQLYKDVYDNAYYGRENIQDFFRYVIGTIYSEPMDTRRIYDDDKIFDLINKTIQEDDYDDVLTLIEAIVQYWEEYLTETRRDRYNNTFMTESLDQIVNEIFQDEYIGQYDDEEDFATQIVVECYELPDFAETYFDYQRFARDLFMCDYWFDDGFVFRAA